MNCFPTDFLRNAGLKVEYILLVSSGNKEPLASYLVKKVYLVGFYNTNRLVLGLQNDILA